MFTYSKNFKGMFHDLRNLGNVALYLKLDICLYLI